MYYFIGYRIVIGHAALLFIGATKGNTIYWAVALDTIHTTLVEASYRLYLEEFHKIAFTPEDIHKIRVCLQKIWVYP